MSISFLKGVRSQNIFPLQIFTAHLILRRHRTPNLYVVVVVVTVVVVVVTVLVVMFVILSCRCAGLLGLWLKATARVTGSSRSINRVWQTLKNTKTAQQKHRHGFGTESAPQLFRYAVSKVPALGDALGLSIASLAMYKLQRERPNTKIIPASWAAWGIAAKAQHATTSYSHSTSSFLEISIQIRYRYVYDEPCESILKSVHIHVWYGITYTFFDTHPFQDIPHYDIALLLVVCVNCWWRCFWRQQPTRLHSHV